MSIVRVYVRTFQNEEHADLFLLLCQKIKKECFSNDIKINLTVLQNETNKSQVTSIWKYEDEKHLKVHPVFADPVITDPLDSIATPVAAQP